MQRVERSTDQAANAYSMFQTAIGLEAQVRVRTDELNSALNRLERLNDQLITARDGAELANRFKTRFFTAVGHDLLQPLHAARLSLSALSESSSGATAAAAHRAGRPCAVDDRGASRHDPRFVEARGGRRASFRAGPATRRPLSRSGGRSRADRAQQNPALKMRPTECARHVGRADVETHSAEPARQCRAIHRAGRRRCFCGAAARG